jgi:translocation protein SEC63
MRLHAYLAQGILPGSLGARWAQLPGLQKSDIRTLPATSRDFADVITHLEEQKNDIAEDARKAMERWGRIEIVDAKFKGMLHYT